MNPQNTDKPAALPSSEPKSQLNSSLSDSTLSLNSRLTRKPQAGHRRSRSKDSDNSAQHMDISHFYVKMPTQDQASCRTTLFERSRLPDKKRSPTPVRTKTKLDLTKNIEKAISKDNDLLIARLQRKCDSQRIQRKEAEVKILSLGRELKAKEEEVRELSKYVKLLRQENAQQSASNLKKLRNSIHQQRKDQMEAEVARLERENELLRQDVYKLRQEKEAYFQEVEELRNDKKPTGARGGPARIIKLENEVSRLRNALEDKEKDISGVGSMEKLLNRSQQQVQRLQKALENLSIKFRLHQRKSDQELQQEMDKKNRQLATLRMRILNLTIQATRNPESVRVNSMMNRSKARVQTDASVELSLSP